MSAAATSPEALAILLREAAAELGVALSEAQLAQFLAYLDELLLWAPKVNLTAIREPRAIVLKHFADSLAPLPHLEGCASLLDLGSGAGLPGLALKIARPEIRLVSVEARRRKVSFQEAVVRRLKLEGVEVIWGRLEPGSRLVPEASVACAISRAVDAAAFLTAAVPLTAPGGRLIVMRGKPGEALTPPPGLTLAREVAYRLPVLGDDRGLAIFEKMLDNSLDKPLP